MWPIAHRVAAAAAAAHKRLFRPAAAVRAAGRGEKSFRPVTRTWWRFDQA
jgi:hypothetical protein